MRFTIRDIIWLTVVVALLISAWVKDRHNVAVRDRLIQEAARWKAECTRLDVERKMSGPAVTVQTTQLESAEQF